MRHALVLCVLLLAVLPAASSGALTADQSATLSGTVTTADGTSVSGGFVLVQNASDSVFQDLTEDRTVHETFLKMAYSDIEGIQVVSVDEQGQYEMSLPPGEYDVVAVTEERLSRPIRNLTVSGETTRNVTVEQDVVVSVRGERVTVAPGNETTLRVGVHNPDDDPARNVSVTVQRPAGIEVSVANATGNPTYHEETGRFVWNEIQSNSTVSVTYTVRVPEEAAADRYIFSFDGRSGTHFVETIDDAIVRLPRGPTPTVHPGGPGSGTATVTETPPPTETPVTDGGGPGFGTAVSVMALVLSGLLYRRQA